MKNVIIRGYSRWVAWCTGICLHVHTVHVHTALFEAKYHTKTSYIYVYDVYLHLCMFVCMYVNVCIFV